MVFFTQLYMYPKIFLFLFLLAPQWFYAQALPASPLPIVMIDTDGWLIFDEPKINATMQVVAHADGTLNQPTDSVKAYNGSIGIELRGKTSQLLSEKKPYAIELHTKDGKKNDMELLGFPIEHDWILLAPYSDKTLLRDVFGFALARKFDAMAYTPRTQMVELLINGEYKGVYVWTEKIKVDPHRVNIADSEKAPERNSFMLKLDKGAGFIANEYWMSQVLPSNALNNQRIRFLYHFPKPEKITPTQSLYMQNWMRAFEDTLRSPGFNARNGGYRRLMDTPSFIDYMLLTELCRNVDGYRISSFFYKDEDSKDPRLHAGPVWDFNIAFGNADFCNAALTEGWAKDFNKVCGKDYWLVPFWWDRLWEDPAFRKEAADRWQNLRKNALSDSEIAKLVEELAVPISGGPAQRNFERWKIQGVKVWPNAYVGKTWEEEVIYLKEWTLARAKWMDGAVK